MMGRRFGFWARAHQEEWSCHGHRIGATLEAQLAALKHMCGEGLSGHSMFSNARRLAGLALRSGMSAHLVKTLPSAFTMELAGVSLHREAVWTPGAWF